MRKPNIILLMAVVIIAASVAVIYRTQFQNTATETTKLPEGLGAAAAEEAAQLLGGKGAVVLILPKRGDFKEPTVELQRSGFARSLARAKGMSLAATEFIETERPGTMGAGGLDPAEFSQLVHRHAGASAFVSLVGIPEVPQEALNAMKGKKFVVVGSSSPQLKAMLVNGVVQVAIIPRLHPMPDKKPPSTAREWFNSAYEVVTPANAGAMP